MSHFNLLIKSYFTDFRAYSFSNWTFISAISLDGGGSSLIYDEVKIVFCLTLSQTQDLAKLFTISKRIKPLLSLIKLLIAVCITKPKKFFTGILYSGNAL